MNLVNTYDQLVNLAQKCQRAPSITLARAYTRAMRDWCTQTQWLRDTLPGATAVNTALYDLGGDPYLDVIGVYAVSLTDTTQTPPRVWTLTVGDPGGWDVNRQPQPPLSFAYVPENGLGLYPTPDKIYPMTITLIITPKEGVDKIPEAPLRKWSNTFEAGALAYLLTLSGAPWKDPNEAALQMKIFQADINNGKADRLRNYTPGARRTRPRPFLIGSTP